MRKLLLFILLFTSTLAYSIPAKRVTKTVLIDGQEVKLTLKGNESAHFWLSEDGKKYSQNADGSFSFFPEENYQMALKRNRYEMKFAESSASNPTALQKARAKRKVKYQGERRGLVILVNYADNKFTSTSNPLEDYKKVLAAENYKGSKNFGSVRDYFKAQSYGKFDFVLDVAGPVTLSHNLNYYGANDSYDDDVRAGTMVWEACKAVDNEVDFSKYDWDGDGVVEQVFVIYAGFGEAAGGKSNTIWPHASTLSEMKKWESEIGSCVFDGVTVDSYACSCELAGSYGATQDGIGTICHEFSHCFGLPDFYCTDSNHSDMCMEEWSLMDYGSYSNSGYTPASYTAYERWFCGWAEPTELSSAQFVKGMKNIDDDGESYIIYNDANKNEYYILQNIQKTGWNSAAKAHGMLVLHVDYNQDAWDDNTPNNTRTHLRMTPICADNKHTATSLSGDTYPGTYKNTSLTDNSSPAATLYNANTDGKKLMHKPITDIAESSDGTISFTFMGGVKIETPTGLSASLKDDEITATWNTPQENVTSYNIKYGTISSNAVSEKEIINEDFSKMIKSSDGNSDISSSLNSYLNTQGFTGTKLYLGTKGMKMSSSTVNGELISPVLSETSGSITVTVSSEVYGKDAAKLTINVYKEGETSSFYTSEPIDAGTTKEITISNVPSRYQIILSSSKRCYLTGFKVSSTASNPYSNETIVTGITSAPYVFSPAVEAEQYWLQIQAVGSDGKTSEWSDIVIVNKGADAINHAVSTPLRSRQYNLNGQEVGADYRGIVIRNGKKILVK